MQQQRKGRKWLHCILPPCLTHTHTHAHTHAHTYRPPTPVPRSRTFLLPSPKPGGEHKAQPTCQLSSNPPRADPHGMQQMLPVNCQEKYPSLSSVGSSLGSPHRGTGEGLGGLEVWVWGLKWAGSMRSHMPPGVGGWGAPCLEAGSPQRGAGTHTQAPTVPGGNPQSPRAKAPACTGERGALPHSFSLQQSNACKG